MKLSNIFKNSNYTSNVSLKNVIKLKLDKAEALAIIATLKE